MPFKSFQAAAHTLDAKRMLLHIRVILTNRNVVRNPTVLDVAVMLTPPAGLGLVQVIYASKCFSVKEVPLDTIQLPVPLVLWRGFYM